MRQTLHPQRRGFSLIELSIVVLIISLLSAVSMTEFSHYLTRSKRAEVTTNLRSIGRLELMYEQDKRAFTPFVKELGFAPERGNRYAYILRDGCSSFEDRSGAVVPASPTQTCIGVDAFKFAGSVAIPPTPGITEEATDTDLLVTAVGNLDNDGDFDQWSMSATPRNESAASTDATCASGDTGPYDVCQDVSDI